MAKQKTPQVNTFEYRSYAQWLVSQMDTLTQSVSALQESASQQPQPA
jgi:hypothetical protein